MTKDQLQKELKEKVKLGLKPSDLKKLKRSKSADDIPTSLTPPLPNPPLKKSQPQLEIPLPPNLKQQISALQDELTTERKRVSSLREDLNNSQAKNKQSAKRISELEDKILELRLDKIKEFGDYLEQKGNLESELELNLKTGTQEIQSLENKLLSVNKKKLELQQQLSQSEIKSAQLKLKSLDNQAPSTFNYWPILTGLVLGGLSCWLLTKNHH